MRATPWITCFWPGLTRLWLRGHWSGLAQATGFSVLLNGALGLQFVWTHLVPQGSLWILWGGVLAAWCVGVWRSARLVLQLAEHRPAKAEEDLFLRAQDEYLKGHWFEAEASLERLLKVVPEDVDAHLMLAGLYRHTRRPVEAERQLRRMQQLDGAGKWHLEIVTELELIARQSQSASVEASPTDPSPLADELPRGQIESPGERMAPPLEAGEALREEAEGLREESLREEAEGLREESLREEAEGLREEAERLREERLREEAEGLREDEKRPRKGEGTKPRIEAA